MIISTKNFGENIRKMRQKAGISQYYVADTCGIDVTTVSKIELGKRYPNLKTAIAIVNCLKSTAGYSSDEQIFLQIEK
jgi:transcriptional regulator with XRE-family HTH domain